MPNSIISEKHIENAQFAMKLAWYQRWLVPDTTKAFSPHTNINTIGFHYLGQAASILGISAFAIAIFLNIYNLKKNLTLSSHVDLDGKITIERRKLDAGFNFANISLYSSAGITYFAFNLSCATPLFILMSATSFVKSLIDLNKSFNELQLLCKEANISTSQALNGTTWLDNIPDYCFFSNAAPTKSQIQKAKLQYHRLNVHYNLINAKFALASLVFTCLWAVQPHITIVALFVIGIAWFFAYKKRESALNKQKQYCISMTKNINKKLKPTPVGLSQHAFFMKSKANRLLPPSRKQNTPDSMLKTQFA